MLEGCDIEPRDPRSQVRGPSSNMLTLVMEIINEQLTSSFPNENIQFYPVPGKPAIIIAAPLPVHDTANALLESLKEVCETLRKLERDVGKPTVVSSRERHVVELIEADTVPQPVTPRPVSPFEPVAVSPYKEEPVATDPFVQEIYDLDMQAVEDFVSQYKPSTNPLWAKIAETEKKLETTGIRVELANVTLQSIAEWLDSFVGIYTTVDGFADQLDIKFEENTIFIIDAKEVPLSLALNRVLKPLGLVYTINEDGDLVITTLESESGMRLTRVYDVPKKNDIQSYFGALSNTVMRSSPGTSIGMAAPGKLIVEAP
jgi:hypothetical protein